MRPLIATIALVFLLCSCGESPGADGTTAGDALVRQDDIAAGSAEATGQGSTTDASSTGWPDAGEASERQGDIAAGSMEPNSQGASAGQISADTPTDDAASRFARAIPLPEEIKPGTPMPDAIAALEARGYRDMMVTGSGVGAQGKLLQGGDIEKALEAAELRASEDLVAIHPVIKNNFLVTGEVGHLPSFDADIEFLGGSETRGYAELARYFDLVILNSKPDVLNDPRIAYKYARRFLTAEAQARFLSAWSAPNTDIPFPGWLGSDEMVREQSYRKFIEEFGDKIAELAPERAARLLKVRRVKVLPYDRSNRKYPIAIRFLPILRGIPTAYDLKFKPVYSLPANVPVPVGEAAKFMSSLQDDEAYLAIELTVLELSPSEVGESLDAKVAVHGATLFADQGLSHKLHEFGLYDAGSGRIGIAGKADVTSHAGGRVSGMEVVHGPDGEDVIQIAMPKDFKPIRLPGLGGLPVVGLPVVDRHGPLNPEQWQLRHGYNPGLDDFSRIIAALRLRSDPGLLRDIEFAEDFARNNLDDETAKTFFPRGVLIGRDFGEGHSERKRLFDEFLRRYEAPLKKSLPTLPFEFTYVDRVVVGEYDVAQRAFPVSHGVDNAGICTLQYLHSRILPYLPQVPCDLDLPVPPQQVSAVLKQLPNLNTTTIGPPLRKAYLGMRLAWTGFDVNKRGQVYAQIEVKTIGLYEDPLLERPIHVYP